MDKFYLAKNLQAVQNVALTMQPLFKKLIALAQPRPAHLDSDNPLQKLTKEIIKVQHILFTINFNKGV